MNNVDCGSCPNISDGCHGLCEKIELDVERWSANWHMEEFYQSKHGDYVSAVDYCSAQSELAALREELAECKRDRDTEQHAAIEANGLLKAAKQRNAELIELLRDCKTNLSKVRFMGLHKRIGKVLIAELTNPTESGASE